MILNAMTTHIDNFNICFNGCGALMNITEENCKFISKQTRFTTYFIMYFILTIDF